MNGPSNAEVQLETDVLIPNHTKSLTCGDVLTTEALEYQSDVQTSQLQQLSLDLVNTTVSPQSNLEVTVSVSEMSNSLCQTDVTTVPASTTVVSESSPTALDQAGSDDLSEGDKTDDTRDTLGYSPRSSTCNTPTRYASDSDGNENIKNVIPRLEHPVLAELGNDSDVLGNEKEVVPIPVLEYLGGDSEFYDDIDADGFAYHDDTFLCIKNYSSFEEYSRSEEAINIQTLVNDGVDNLKSRIINFLENAKYHGGVANMIVIDSLNIAESDLSGYSTSDTEMCGKCGVPHKKLTMFRLECNHYFCVSSLHDWFREQKKQDVDTSTLICASSDRSCAHETCGLSLSRRKYDEFGRVVVNLLQRIVSTYRARQVEAFMNLALLPWAPKRDYIYPEYCRAQVRFLMTLHRLVGRRVALHRTIPAIPTCLWLLVLSFLVRREDEGVIQHLDFLPPPRKRFCQCCSRNPCPLGRTF